MDVFQYCRFLRHAGKIMVAFVVALTGLSYYAVLTELANAAHEAGWVMRVALLVCALVFTMLIFMLLWSYFTTVLTDPGRVPAGWHPFPDAEQVVLATAHVLRCSPPPQNRAHPATAHPSTSAMCGGRATAKSAAHGSPLARTTAALLGIASSRWITTAYGWYMRPSDDCATSPVCAQVNTIGLLNYKAFVLFLTYTFISTAVAVCILLRAFIAFVKAPSPDTNVGRPITLFMSFVVDVAFVLSLAGFLGIHIRLLTRNMTTIEHFEKDVPEQWPFDRGWRRNLQAVFGTVPARWLVPGYTRQEVGWLLRGVLCLMMMPPEGPMRIASRTAQ